MRSTLLNTVLQRRSAELESFIMYAGREDDFEFKNDNCMCKVPASYIEDYEMFGLDDDEDDDNDDIQIPDYHPNTKDPCIYIRDLEHLNASFVYEYVTKHLYHNFTTNTTNYALKTVYRENQVIHTYTDDDSGDTIFESDITTDADVADVREEDFDAKKDRIPYLLYRLNSHNVSSMRVHIISLVFATVRANNVGGYQKYKPQLIFSNPVYKLDYMGNMLDPISLAEKDNSKCRTIKTWIQTQMETPTEIGRDIEELCSCFKVCGIDMATEDLRGYTDEFIKKIARKYLVDNCEYVLRKTGSYAKNVLKALKTMSLDMCVSRGTEQEAGDTFLTEDTIYMFESVSEFPRGYEFIQADNRPNMDATIMEYIMKYVTVELYKQRGSNDYPMGKLKYDDSGFLLDRTGEVFVVSTQDYPESKLSMEMAIVHRSGILVSVTPDKYTFYVTDIYPVLAYLTAFTNAGGNYSDTVKDACSEIKWSMVSL